jgi:short/branched chain acyl-CoA dehydrogenase
VDFDLTREQEMIRKEVRKFAQSEISPVALELDEAEAFSPDLTRKMGEIGLFGMFVSEAYEGQAMDYISYIIAVEEIARVDGSQAATIAAGNSLGIGPLYYFGNEEQKQKYLPKLCNGEALWGFGLDRTHRRIGCRWIQDHGGARRQRMGDQWFQNFHYQRGQ